ncbi:MAG: SDR family NAD(P)-dependent oxidoreductase [Ignavibacteria bacterium]|nr:SDR family NAD(P)-dependent oxidoreductase [Ignavibacteria bacterium]
MSKILITGCKGGIGLGAALRLAATGHFIYATVQHEESIAELKRKLEPFAENTLVEKLDITNSDDRKKNFKLGH